MGPDMAVRISKAAKTSPESRLKMQLKLDLWFAEQKDLNVIPFRVNERVNDEIMEGRSKDSF